MKQLLVTGILVALTLTGGIDSAEGSEPAMAEERHCVVHVVGIDQDLQMRMGAEECFDTFSDAVFALSGGAVVIPYDTPVRVLSAEPDYISPLASFTIGIHYDGYNGTGSSLSVSGANCSGGWWNTPGWFDNRESSSYNGCYRLKHFDYPSATGAVQHTTGVGQTDNLSTLNNRVESVSYHGS